jgi:hypothetical protein
MFIEMAMDSLKHENPTWLERQQRELSSFGESRAKQLGATGLSDDFRKGYELGLEVARVYLRGNFAAVQAKVDFWGLHNDPKRQSEHIPVTLFAFHPFVCGALDNLGE